MAGHQEHAPAGRWGGCIGQGPHLCQPPRRADSASQWLLDGEYCSDFLRMVVAPQKVGSGVLWYSAQRASAGMCASASARGAARPGMAAGAPRAAFSRGFRGRNRGAAGW